MCFVYLAQIPENGGLKEFLFCSHVDVNLNRLTQNVT